MRRAFTLLEVLVAAGLFTVILGALMYAWSSTQRTDRMANLYLDLVENVGIAMAQFRAEVRQAAFVPGKPVIPYSIGLVADPDITKRALIFRRSTAFPVSPGPAGSSTVIVEFRAVPASGAGRYHLARVVRTASGAPLPGLAVRRQETVFRAFQISDFRAKYEENDAEDARVLHVTLTVVNDAVDLGDWGPFRNREMIVTNTLQIARPEVPFDPRRPFAAPMPPSPDLPPGDVRAPAADVQPLVP